MPQNWSPSRGTRNQGRHSHSALLHAIKASTGAKGLKRGLGHHRKTMATTGKYLATQEEMVEARLTLGSRDMCSKLLIPLNKCRQETFYLPWKCEDQRHGYEKCEYDLFLQRMKKMQEMRQGNNQQQPIPATQ